MKLIDIKSQTEIQATGRRTTPKKRVPSANDLNPFEWSKWLYEIRRQLGRGTSRAEAYEDCRFSSLRGGLRLFFHQAQQLSNLSR
jgi:hypothetical protein